MRYVLFFWALPLGLFWGWYFLSFHDINFGYLFLSRVLHDAVFQIYGNMLGIDPERIPGMLVKACVMDTALIGGILAWRRRKPIRAWIIDYRLRRAAAAVNPSDREAGRERPAG